VDESKSSALAHTTTAPATLAGDPFAYAGSLGSKRRECFCGCYSGVVYLGELVVDPESGEEVEVYVAVRCRRCGEKVP
jgi:hypothetical protein